MDTFSSGLMLWLGLMSLVPKPPVYEIEHFYTYNSEHKQVALPLQKKVFIPASEKGEAYIKNLTQKVERLQSPHTPGWVVFSENNREAIALMKQLAKDNIEYKPVVRWENMDCIPTNTLLVQTKPFATEQLIRKRMETAAKVKIITLQPTGQANQYAMEISETIVPPNTLVLANMISEDTAWVEWARVVFAPLYSPLSGSMSITTPAVLNLGYDKQLEVVITVYKPGVKIRKDMLPKLGHNRFVPFPQKDDVWYDFGPTTVNEETLPEKTVIRMVTPFRYLNYGRVDIPQIEVAFEDDKKPGTFIVPGTSYFTQSVIKGTAIDDIQEFPQFPPLPQSAAPERFSRVVLPWKTVGFAGIGLGFGLVVLVCLVIGVRAAGKASGSRANKAANRKLWQELFDAPLAQADWRVVYKDTNAKLSKILAVFYNTHVPVGAEFFKEDTNNPLYAILMELDNLYKPTASPNQKELAKQVAAFVRGSAVAHV